MKTNYETILFDLDGTLTDPQDGIVNSVKFALKSFDINQLDEDQLIKAIGNPLKDIFAGLYNLKDQDLDLAIQKYREYFTVQGLFENSKYEGIDELLQTLFKMNKKLIVATLKPTVYAVEILKNFHLDEYFYFISGIDLEAENVTKSKVIMKTLEELGAEAGKEIVMVGDRNHDIIGAKHNNIDSIGVLYGYGSLAELSSEKPKYLVNSVDELKELLI